jgi:hypothetical protein
MPNLAPGSRVRDRDNFFGAGELLREDDTLRGWVWVRWDTAPPRDYNTGSE